MPELFYTVRAIYRRNLDVVPLLMVAAAWYLVILTVLSLAQHRIARRFARGQLQRERTASKLPPRAPATSTVSRNGSRPSIAPALQGNGATVSLQGVGKVFGDQTCLRTCTWR